MGQGSWHDPVAGRVLAGGGPPHEEKGELEHIRICQSSLAQPSVFEVLVSVSERFFVHRTIVPS